MSVWQIRTVVKRSMECFSSLGAQSMSFYFGLWLPEQLKKLVVLAIYNDVLVKIIGIILSLPVLNYRPVAF